MAALLSAAGVRDVCLNFPHSLGGQVVKFSPAVSGLGSCVASYLDSYLDKLPMVACPLQSPSARVLVCSVAKVPCTPVFCSIRSGQGYLGPQDSGRGLTARAGCKGGLAGLLPA